MQNYAHYHKGIHRWLLGSFVLPLAQWDTFVNLLPALPVDPPQPWSLSLIGSQDWQAAIAHVQAHAPSDALPIQIKALEFPPLASESLEQILPQLPAGIDIFVELPLQGDWQPCLPLLQRSGVMAKLRTGGLTPAAIPTAPQLAEILIALAEAQIPFKATAGLHHPLPGNHSLDQQPHSPTAQLHGFLNLAVLAALLYWRKLTLSEALDLLNTTTLQDFRFQPDGLGWKDQFLTLEQITEARQQFWRSFGSCSFDEPVNDLKALQLL
jgi:hypothetical protein